MYRLSLFDVLVSFAPNKLSMQLVSVRRKTKKEKRFSQNMGILTTNVVYIQKTLLNIPIKTLHKYRETYYGEVKDCDMCRISA